MEGSQKVTVGQACRDLGVSWHTLNLWMRKLGIEHERHPLYLRVRLLTIEQVAAIRRARAEMPGSVSQNGHAILRPVEGQQRPLPRLDLSGQPSPPVSRPSAPPQRKEGMSGALPPLPDGLVSQEEILRRCGRPETTLKRHIANGGYKRAPGGPWSSGQDGRFRITVAFDRETAEAIIARYGQASASSAARPEVVTVKRAEVVPMASRT